MSEDPRVPLAYERTDLAYDRTQWAAERTLMAWMRTTLAMVGFGFAMEKVFEFLKQQDPAVHIGPGYYCLSLGLVVVGIVLLVLAMLEHRMVLGRLQRTANRCTPRFSLPLFGASLILLLCVAALVLVLLRWPV